MNFNYFISDTVADYLIDAVDLIATEGHRLLSDYRFDPHTGLWRHQHAAARAPLRLADLHYTADGTLTGPARRPSAGEDVLGGYLHAGRGGDQPPPRRHRRRPNRPPGRTSRRCAGSTYHRYASATPSSPAPDHHLTLERR